MPPLAQTVETWSEDIDRRLSVLRLALPLVEEVLGDGAAGVLQSHTESTATLLETLERVLEAAVEIAGPEATVVVPGQVNYIDRRTPRGVGFVATDAACPVSRFAGMVFGPLLAGNGLVLAPHPGLQRVADLVAGSLHRAGVPRSVVRLAPQGGPQTALAMADDMFHFAVTDMATEQTARINERLAATRETKGQTWVKALFSMHDCHRPGEPGFVGQFALPKTVAVRTLRLGADLSMPGFQTDWGRH
jgi:acyl-CoA reductase-like NAD-dependent aldehyde dehydrogenase